MRKAARKFIPPPMSDEEEAEYRKFVPRDNREEED